MRAVKGIIFDFDGVIVDSETLYIEALQGYLETLGIETEAQEIAYVIGQHVQDIASDIISQFDLELTVDVFVSESTEFYRNRNKDRNYPLLPGIREFLDSCRAKGIRMAVASSSGYQYLFTILEKEDLLQYFEFILSGKELVHSKPDPEIYHIAAERLGIGKNELMIIEDSTNGVKAGVASGIYTVAYKGARFVQDTSFADIEVRDFKEIQI